MISRLLATIDRVQRTMLFKIIASIAVVISGVGVFAGYAVQAARLRTSTLGAIESSREAAQSEREREANERQAAGEQPATPGESAPKPIESFDATAKVLRGIVQAQHSPMGVGIITLAVVGVLLAVIWLGLGLTAFILLCSAALLVALFSALKWYTLTSLVIGVLTLAGAFSVVMRLLSLGSSGSGSVWAIAKNTLVEAVRMKVGMILIVLLIFGLAALPLLLDRQPLLRYKVQSFLQYATGGSAWLISVLVVVFSVATVAVDQRDKLIWQTITKPVSAAKYILGKWLGVAMLSAGLLAVAGTGVFAFTEFLRRQPAQDERAAFVPIDANQLFSKDRFILETQVLTSQRVIDADPPDLDLEQLEKNIQARIDAEVAAMGEFEGSSAEYRAKRAAVEQQVRDSLLKNIDAAYRTIGPGGSQYFTFSGLQEAKSQGKALILRYKVNSGGNMPDQLYRVTFAFPSMQAAQVFEVPLSQPLTLEMMPGVIDDNGRVLMQVINADIERQTVNPLSITFPPDGLRLAYSSGAFHANFLRVIFVLWIKMLFLAMLGIAGATFLSFPVATMVAATVFITAEGAGYLIKALEVYDTKTLEGKTIWIKAVIAYLAGLIAKTFRLYAELRPTDRLVQGEAMSLGSMSVGVAVLLLWTALLYAAGVLILRRRQLAIYSGQ